MDHLHVITATDFKIFVGFVLVLLVLMFVAMALHFLFSHTNRTLYKKMDEDISDLKQGMKDLKLDVTRETELQKSRVEYIKKVVLDTTGDVNETLRKVKTTQEEFIEEKRLEFNEINNLLGEIEAKVDEMEESNESHQKLIQKRITSFFIDMIELLEMLMDESDDDEEEEVKKPTPIKTIDLGNLGKAHVFDFGDVDLELGEDTWEQIRELFDFFNSKVNQDDDEEDKEKQTPEPENPLTVYLEALKNTSDYLTHEKQKLTDILCNIQEGHHIKLRKPNGYVPTTHLNITVTSIAAKAISMFLEAKKNKAGNFKGNIAGSFFQKMYKDDSYRTKYIEMLSAHLETCIRDSRPTSGFMSQEDIEGSLLDAVNRFYNELLEKKSIPVE